MVAIVAMASTTTDLFEHGAVQLASKKGSDNRDIRRLLHPGSDLVTSLRAFGVFFRRPTTATSVRFSLIHKSMVEALQLQRQLQNSIALQQHRELSLDEADEVIDRPTKAAGIDEQGTPILSSDSEIILRKLISLGLIDQVARRATVQECRDREVPFHDIKTSKVPYIDIRSGSAIFIHPSSSVATTVPAPDYVVYCCLQKSKRGLDSTTSNTFMKGVTVVTKPWLDEIGFDEERIERLYQRPLEGI